MASQMCVNLFIRVSSTLISIHPQLKNGHGAFPIHK